MRFSRAFSTVEVLSRNLESQNQKLLELDRLKDEFLANTSHELRTPLHGLIGLGDSLLLGAAGELPAAAQDNVRLMTASGRRLANMVNDILDFSRARHGDIQLHLRAVDLNGAIEMALALTRPLLTRKGVELQFLPGPPRTVRADPDRLEQILLNLLGNAVKFTHRGRIEVMVEVRSQGMAEVSVSDTGIGIPGQIHDRIFESFVQADGSIERSYGGTGLGLSISKKLVELQGGVIGVESAPGQGSRFFFTLALEEVTQPVAPIAAMAMPAPVPVAPMLVAAASSQEAAAIGADRAKLPIAESQRPAPDTVATTLIVDDDPVNLRVLQNLLALMKHEVLSASSGAEALGIL